MTILVIAEHDNTTLKSSTLNTLSAARQLGADVHLLVAGHNALPVAEYSAAVDGVSMVLLADAPHLADGLAENLDSCVIAIAASYSHILVAATAFGKNIAPRIAARLDVAQISDVTAIINANTFERPIYAGSAIATVQSMDRIKVLTVRTTAFSSVGAAKTTVAVKALDCGVNAGLSSLTERSLETLDRPELSTASIVISGGRAFGSKQHYESLLVPLADKLGAALGASRAAVDAGIASNDAQVGQTGKIVAPDLYIAVGISGAIQHLAGMKDSKVIVAINQDPEAPIFSVADYGLVGDLFTIIPQLTAALS